MSSKGDAAPSDITLTEAAMKDSEGGCHVSLPMAFLMVLMAGAIAAGVGVVCFFSASGKSTIVCECKFPEPEPAPTPSWEETWRRCEEISVARNICLSAPHCSGHKETTDPTSTPTTTVIVPTTTPRPPDVRLPLKVYPLHYDLELQPFMYGPEPDQYIFNGSVQILLRCDEDTDVITLHAETLTILSSSLTSTDSSAHPDVATIQTDDVREFLRIHLSGPLSSGKNYTLRLTFSGPLKDDMTGFYRSSYMRGNETVWMAATFFAPTDARKAFPCFDEPAVKAPFRVTLVRKRHLTAISNMPLDQSVNRTDDWVADTFQDSVSMSTYLLAFVISDLVYKQNFTKNGTQVRVWARREALDQVNYALSVAVPILERFEEYFDIPYPLPKQDMIALPDFAAGAMENWGLITYRETALLYDPAVSSGSDKQRVATVVSHELAHQWFGNLVTPSWWDDIWLNEGFASYVEYIGVDYVEPSWNMMEQILTLDVQRVFKMDALGTSHPIYQDASYPDEINQLFDAISYAKGASVIRMMHYFLGENTFRHGLSKYLRKYEYGAAHHDRLWETLTEQATSDGKTIDVKKIMETWIKQMGFPVVTLTRTGNDVTGTQQHFLTDPSQTPSQASPFNYRWEIPFTYTTDLSNPSESIIYVEKGGGPTYQVPAGTKWILANIEGQGYYRVSYDKSNWDALSQQLKDNLTVIGVLNRAQLIDDAFNLGRAEHINQTVALSMIEYLSEEHEYLPWSTATTNLGYMSSMLSLSPANGLFKRYLGALVAPLYNYTGWEDRPNDSHLIKFLRGIAVSYACSTGNRDCVDMSLRLFREWMANPSNNQIPQDIKTTVYCTAIANGGESEWDFAFERHQAANVASEKVRLRDGMACTSQPWLLQRYLEYTLDSSKIRSQDATYAISSISKNSIGRTMAWNFLQSNWDHFMNTYGSLIFQFARLVTGITDNFNTQLELEQLESFMERNPNQGTAARAFQQAVESTKVNIRWMNRNLDDVTQWLQNKMAAGA